MNMQTKHPRALNVFFVTEMWERYGFYAIQSLLALYLSLHFGLDDARTYALVGSFTALTYISPIVGGWIADHLWGQKQAVLMGAIILFAAYVLLALDQSQQGMLAALAIVAVGTGLLKPNIASLLGRQYALNDPKRDSGFTIYYLGITSGIILGTTLPDRIQHNFGWEICFLSASFGLFLACLTFLVGKRIFHIPDYAVLKWKPLINNLLAGLISLGFCLLSYLVLDITRLANLFFGIVVCLALGFVIWVASRESGMQRKKTLSFLLLCVVSTFFWALYFQMFMSLTLFINRVVEPHLFGLLLSPPNYVTIQSLGMLVIGVFLQKLWRRQSLANVAYSTSIKFSIAMILMLMAYLILVFSLRDHASQQLILPSLVIIAYLVISGAELMLSPIGLSAVTHLISPKVVSTMMGIFYVSLGGRGIFGWKNGCDLGN